MTDSRVRQIVAAGVLALMLIPIPAAAAQQAAPARPAAGAANAVEAAPPVTQDAVETRQDFYRVLEQYPPALGRVMRLDPTLMTNASYLASYPNVAAFFARYPDVPRNPGYYLERYDSGYIVSEPRDVKSRALSMWEDALQFIGVMIVIGGVIYVLFGIIKYIVEYRRWHRISRVNAEVHNKILDRFGSNEELLAYVDSPAGRRFLEATPMAPNAPPSRSVGAPFGRMLFAVQLGVILISLSVGFWAISNRAIEEVQPVVVALAMLALCLGIGSIISAGASYLLSRKLGLLPEPPVARPEHIA
jgi:hypothetical protein